MRAFRCIVVGAGPAGLSAAAELSAHGVSCLLVDEGHGAAQRDRHAPRDLLAGVGGAGLFSDGKHSFYPSATALWRLRDRTALAHSFDATVALLARFGVDGGVFPTASNDASPAAGAWQPKSYPSIYVSLPARLAIIEALAPTELQTSSRVIGARRDGNGEGIIVRVANYLGDEELRAEHVVFAGGRWSPLALREIVESLGAQHSFLRVEFGVRIELSADATLFAQLPGVDGKICFVDDEAQVEMRTFCNCRNGEVMLGEAHGWRAYSGRADGPPTGRSNVGLVVRTRNPALGRAVLDAVKRATPRAFSLTAWDDNVAAIFGGDGAALLARARDRLLEYSPVPTTAIVHAPILEGVGDYPVTAPDDLRVAPGVWVAGDACGRFRGIVAAMVSGRYVAQQILRDR